MIVTEFYETREDGVNLYRTFSDANVYIRKVGTEETYIEAIDIENSGFTYEETDIPIEESEETDETIPDIVIDPDEATDEDYQAALAEMGVKFNDEN